jgi:hypothetical protein
MKTERQQPHAGAHECQEQFSRPLYSLCQRPLPLILHLLVIQADGTIISRVLVRATPIEVLVVHSLAGQRDVAVLGHAGRTIRTRGPLGEQRAATWVHFLQKGVQAAPERQSAGKECADELLNTWKGEKQAPVGLSTWQPVQYRVHGQGEIHPKIGDPRASVQTTGPISV